MIIIVYTELMIVILSLIMSKTVEKRSWECTGGIDWAELANSTGLKGVSSYFLSYAVDFLQRSKSGIREGSLFHTVNEHILCRRAAPEINKDYSDLRIMQSYQRSFA